MNRKPNLKWLRGVDWKNGSQRDLAVFIAGACLVLILVSLGLDSLIEKKDREMPDFALISDINERKAAFFDFMLPYVEEANYQILEDRDELKKLQNRFLGRKSLGRRDADRVHTFLEEYRFEPVKAITEETFRHLLTRVDVIPPSLALSQAALESAWGSSRFAREGYNLFGIWCYEPGCGMVPARRPAGKTYEVTKYDSPRDSFSAYFRNLNTSRYYLELRAIRRALRNKEVEVSGYDLADGLNRYSQEGMTYVSKVQSLIRSNRLARFD